MNYVITVWITIINFWATALVNHFALEGSIADIYPFWVRAILKYTILCGIFNQNFNSFLKLHDHKVGEGEESIFESPEKEAWLLKFLSRS